MRSVVFFTLTGLPVPALTAAQMRRVDDLAVGPYRLSLLQMMENAGRNLALQALEMGARAGPVLVLAGPGGNGGGGLCAARHLHNHGVAVRVALASPSRLSPAAARQWHTLQRAGVTAVSHAQLPQAMQEAALIIDALLGYSLRGAPRPPFDAWVQWANAAPAPVLSLDVPTGVDATTGETPGEAIRPQVTLTLALPKTGLHAVSGEIVLADIGIPPALYREIGLEIGPVFSEGYRLTLMRGDGLV